MRIDVRVPVRVLAALALAASDSGGVAVPAAGQATTAQH